MSEREELEAELDALVKTAEQRRDSARDPFLIGIRPAASDWMTREEVHRLCELQAALVPYAHDDMMAARERVAVKRVARRAARSAA